MLLYNDKKNNLKQLQTKICYKIKTKKNKY